MIMRRCLLLICLNCMLASIGMSQSNLNAYGFGGIFTHKYYAATSSILASQSFQRGNAFGAGGGLAYRANQRWEISGEIEYNAGTSYILDRDYLADNYFINGPDIYCIGGGVTFFPFKFSGRFDPYVKMNYSYVVVNNARNGWSIDHTTATDTLEILSLNGPNQQRFSLSAGTKFHLSKSIDLFVQGTFSRTFIPRFSQEVHRIMLTYRSRATEVDELLYTGGNRFHLNIGLTFQIIGDEE